MTDKDEMKVEVIKDAEFEITGVDLEMNPQKESEVKRIRFKTNKGDITWKPKVTKKQLMDGLTILKTVSMELGQLPKKLSEIGEITSDKGRIKVKGQYSKGVAIQDGNEITYRFITSGKTFDKWELIKEKVEEEVITD